MKKYLTGTKNLTGLIETILYNNDELNTGKKWLDTNYTISDRIGSFTKYFLCDTRPLSPAFHFYLA